MMKGCLNGGRAKGSRSRSDEKKRQERLGNCSKEAGIATREEGGGNGGRNVGGKKGLDRNG